MHKMRKNSGKYIKRIVVDKNGKKVARWFKVVEGGSEESKIDAAYHDYTKKKKYMSREKAMLSIKNSYGSDVAESLMKRMSADSDHYVWNKLWDQADKLYAKNGLNIVSLKKNEQGSYEASYSSKNDSRAKEVLIIPDVNGKKVSISRVIDYDPDEEYAINKMFEDDGYTTDSVSHLHDDVYKATVSKAGDTKTVIVRIRGDKVISEKPDFSIEDRVEHIKVREYSGDMPIFDARYMDESDAAFSDGVGLSGIHDIESENFVIVDDVDIHGIVDQEEQLCDKKINAEVSKYGCRRSRKIYANRSKLINYLLYTGNKPTVDDNDNALEADVFREGYDSVEEYIRSLSHITTSCRYKSDTVVWRGMSIDMAVKANLYNCKDGDEVRFSGFLSTSMSPSVAKSFSSGGAILEIIAPKGSLFGIASENESESLFAPNTTIRILKSFDFNGEKVILSEIVSQTMNKMGNKHILV